MNRGSLLVTFIGGVVAASLGFLWVERSATAQEGQAPAAAAPQGAGQPGTRMSEAELKARFFEFSGGRTLRPRTWPNGARAAVVIGFDANATAGLINNNIAPNAMQQAEFGAEAGLPRLLRVLDKHGIPATMHPDSSGRRTAAARLDDFSAT
jgi:hypothetical protein